MALHGRYYTAWESQRFPQAIVSFWNRLILVGRTALPVALAGLRWLLSNSQGAEGANLRYIGSV